jgi:hypothetical protein
MENLILLLTASLVLYKKKKQLRTTVIGNTGCSVLFSPETTFEYTRTDEGDEMYYGERSEKEVSYGVLCARLNDPVSFDEAREITMSYLQNLRRPFEAPYATGMQVDMEVQETRGLIAIEDYWQDKCQLDWKVKAFASNRVICVLYVRNIAAADSEATEQFFDSFSCAD